MSLARPALLALLVGLAVLASPALLLQFQAPTECANSVDPGPAPAEASAPVFQYEDLSPDAKRAFDRARSAQGSVTVTGSDCPEEFEYSPQRQRYEIVRDDSRYVLTTYANDLLPEVPIAAGVLAFLGLAVTGIGLATRDDPDARFPMLAGVGGLVALATSTAAVVAGGTTWVLAAAGGTVLLTAATLLGAGVALPRRRALALGVALAVLPVLAGLPLAGVSAWFLAPAALSLVLVGVGMAARTLLDWGPPDSSP